MKSLGVAISIAASGHAHAHLMLARIAGMLPFSLRQIRAFLAVQEHASVTGAAKALCRSQTAVTKSIQDLERSIGVPLFDRTPKGMSLTAFGEILLPRARTVGAFNRRAAWCLPHCQAVERDAAVFQHGRRTSGSLLPPTADHQNIYWQRPA
jgi:molybdenum-dependent DNA-binding transcriptional regulator ModE